MKKLALLLVILLLIVFEGKAQCIDDRIDAPSAVCLSESFNVNHNIDAIEYSWDFCPGDLISTPTPASLATLANGSLIFDLEMVKVNGEWYGFALGAGSNSVIRIDFGTDLDPANIVETDLGNPGALLSTPTSIDIIQSNSEWFGVVANQNKTITLLSFGEMLTSAPVASTLLSDIGGQENAICAVPSGEQSVDLFVSDFSGNVTRIIFAEGLKNNFTSTQIISTDGLQITDLQMLHDCTGWNLFVLIFDHKTLGRLFFGDNLSNEPQKFTYSNLEFSFSPYRFSMLQEGSHIYSLVTNISGGAAAVDIGPASNENPQLTDFGSLGVLSDSWNIFGLKKQDEWSAITINGKSRGIFRLTFPNVDCTNANLKHSLNSNPGTITYTELGQNEIILDVTYNNGTSESVGIPIKVTAPFTASFTPPSDDPLCTNQQVVFTNTSVINEGDDMQWSWMVDNQPIATTKNLEYAFTSTDEKIVELMASNGGCESSAQTTITSISEGPHIDFSAPDHCFGETTTFSNISSGEIESFSWSFGDNSTSDVTEPAHKFAAPGTFEVTLSAASFSGCNNSATKEVTIFSLPSVNFEIDPPPSACSESTTSFNDLTTDEYGLASWQWYFGDGSDSQISTQQNATHIFVNDGKYSVVFKVTNSVGCVDSLTKEVTIYESPSAAFDFTPVCIGTPVQFNAQGEKIKNWSWTIGNKTYGIQNPKHIFRSGGSELIELTVVGDNDCVASNGETIQVPEEIVPDFTVEKNCVDEAAVFTDASLGDDPVTDWQWFLADEMKTGQSTTYTFHEPGTQQVKLTVTSQSGCSYSVIKTFDVVPHPIAAFSMSSEIGSPPFPIQFTNKSTNASIFQWNFDDGTESTMLSPEHIFTDVGEYTISLTAMDESGCSDIVSRSLSISAAAPDVNIMAITTAENPDGSTKLTVVLQNEGNTIVKDLKVDIDISGKVSLREMVDGELMPGARVNLPLTFGVDINDIVFICANASLESDVTPQSNRNCIQFEKTAVIFMPVYPNPARTSFDVEWVSTDTEVISAALYNAFGVLVWSNIYDSVKGLNTVKVDLSQVHEGVYVLTLNGKGIKTTQRVLLTK